MSLQEMTEGTLNEVLALLMHNSWETAEAYALYDKNSNIRQIYPNRESYNRSVRRLKAKYKDDTDFSALIEKVMKKHSVDTSNGQASFTENSNEGTATAEIKGSSRVQTLEELLSACSVDLNVWTVDTYKCETWEQNSVTEGIVTLYLVKANLKRIQPRVPVIHPIILPDVDWDNKYVSNTTPTGRSLVIGDAQIGFNSNSDGTWETFHDRRAMDVTLQIIRDNKFDNIIILGDMLDITEASKYAQKPEFARTLQPSINELGLYLTSVRKYAPTSKIVYLNGNHEFRLERSLVESLKYAYGLTAFNSINPLLSIKNLLSMDSIGIEVIEDYPKGVFWINDIVKVIHGEFVNISKELTTTNTHTIMGHIHRIGTQSRTVFDRSGQYQVSVNSIGCLCKIDGTVPGAVARPDWQNGILEVFTDKDYVGYNHIHILEGVALYNSKKYSGKDHFPGGLVV